MFRRAFTLIELLVVIAIILVLTGLLLSGISAVRRALAIAETSRRMTEVQTALQSYAASSTEAPGLERLLGNLRSLVRSGTLAQPASAIPGVVRYRTDTRIGVLQPDSGEAWPESAGGRPAWMLAHPWGMKPTDFLTDPEGNSPPTRLPNPTEEAALAVDDRGLSEFTPNFSAELLMLAGVLPLEAGDGAAVDAARQMYRSDRRPRAPWNDAWGNPLVVGFAWYHPRRNTTISNRGAGGWSHNSLNAALWSQANREDLFIQRAKERYGYFRSVWVAVSAIGSEPPATITATELKDPAGVWTGNAGVQARIWASADTDCNREGGLELWRSRAGTDVIARPPWNGARQMRSSGSIRMLSAPLEIR